MPEKGVFLLSKTLLVSSEKHKTFQLSDTYICYHQFHKCKINLLFTYLSIKFLILL